MFISFNTVNGKYCCNYNKYDIYNMFLDCFNTVNGKYCCNVWLALMVLLISLFQYRKR